MLIDPADLDPAAVVLLDVRWTLAGADRAGYAAGHLPGAVFVDLDAELAAPPGAHTGRHPLPSPAALTASARRWGVHADSTVVAYDDAGGTSAARAWWLLRWGGLADVRVLDGGLRAWHGALSTVGTTPEPGTVTLAGDRMPTLTADEAAALARDGTLLDARTAERYRGEHEPVDPVAGHVPGAVSAPTGGNLGPDGRFLAPDALRRRFAELGAGEDTGVYCGSGVTAAHQVLALHVAGIEAALWPGSWSEWVSDPSRPVATGP